MSRRKLHFEREFPTCGAPMYGPACGEGRAYRETPDSWPSWPDYTFVRRKVTCGRCRRIMQGKL